MKSTGEFLSLMFLWTAVGSYQMIFAMGENAHVVSETFMDIQVRFCVCVCVCARARVCVGACVTF